MIRLTEALATNRVGKYNVGDKVTLDGKSGRVTTFEFAKSKGSAGVNWWTRIQFTDGTAQWFDMSNVEKLQKESLVTEASPSEYQGAKIHFQMIRRGRGSHEYIATLQSGDWPSDADLITLADGSTPPNSRHFGGSVRSAGHDRKNVTVFVD